MTKRKLQEGLFAKNLFKLQDSRQCFREFVLKNVALLITW